MRWKQPVKKVHWTLAVYIGILRLITDSVNSFWKNNIWTWSGFVQYKIYTNSDSIKELTVHSIYSNFEVMSVLKNIPQMLEKQT